MATSVEAYFKCTLGEDAFAFRRMKAVEKLGGLSEYRLEPGLQVDHR